jgi:hypothetical protein
LTFFPQVSAFKPAFFSLKNCALKPVLQAESARNKQNNASGLSLQRQPACNPKQLQSTKHSNLQTPCKKLSIAMLHYYLKNKNNHKPPKNYNSNHHFMVNQQRIWQTLKSFLGKG